MARAGGPLHVQARAAEGSCGYGSWRGLRRDGLPRNRAATRRPSMTGRSMERRLVATCGGNLPGVVWGRERVVVWRRYTDRMYLPGSTESGAWSLYADGAGGLPRAQIPRYTTPHRPAPRPRHRAARRCPLPPIARGPWRGVVFRGPPACPRRARDRGVSASRLPAVAQAPPRCSTRSRWSMMRASSRSPSRYWLMRWVWR
jgi:hypothetical protein